MQFLIVGLDGTDEQALERRLAVRPDHLAFGDELLSSGNLWYGAALVNDEGTMIGSMYLVDFPDRAEFEHYLEQEPYMTGGVWQHVDVRQCRVRDPWRFNRPNESFESTQS